MLIRLPKVHSWASTDAKQVVTDWISSQTTKTTPLTNTVFCFPPDDQHVSDSVTFLQASTNTRLHGLKALKETCKKWEQHFDDDLGTSYNLKRISMISPTQMVAQWNVTWVPPTASWLQSLAKINNWTPEYMSYVHMSGQISTFSYMTVAKLFLDAISTKTLRIPLACIDGTTTYDFEKMSTNQNDNFIVQRITEELGYAQDLKRRSLKNRKCALDLRMFLEDGRRIHNTRENGHGESWEDIVVVALPWSSVSGLNSLEIEPNDGDEAMVPVLFLCVSTLALLAFATVAAPELIGQSLFGPPTYIVPPLLD